VLQALPKVGAIRFTTSKPTPGNTLIRPAGAPTQEPPWGRDESREMREGNNGLARNRIVGAIRHGQHPSPAPSGHPLSQGARGLLALLMLFLMLMLLFRVALGARRMGVCAQGATGQGRPVERCGDTMSPHRDPEHTAPAGDRHRRCRRSNQGVLFLVTFFAQAKQVTPSGERAQATRKRRPRAVAAAKKRLNARIGSGEKVGHACVAVGSPAPCGAPSPTRGEGIFWRF